MKSHALAIYLILSTDLGLVLMRRLDSIKLYSLEECDSSVSSIDLKEEPNAADHSVVARFDIPEDLGKSAEVTLIIAKWRNNVWSEVYETDGNFFDFMYQHFPEFWEQFRSASFPKIEDKDEISAGQYLVKMNQDMWKNVDISQIDNGKFLLTLILSSKGKLVFCVRAIVGAF